MLLTILRSFLIFSVTVLADVQFSTPVAGKPISSNTQIPISWVDGPDQPALAKLTTYTIFLMVGGSTEATAEPILSVAGDHTASTSKSKVLTITSPAVGPPDTNAYFLKIQSNGPNGQVVINYSDRFSIPNMSGSWPSPALQAAYSTVKGDPTAVPPTQVQGANVAAPAGAAGAVPANALSMPLSEQSGPVMYAPMMNYPGSVITKTNTDRLYPTSSWSLATTYLPSASVTLTMTQSGTHSMKTIENTAAPASTPMNDMEKFLNRWKD